MRIEEIVLYQLSIPLTVPYHLSFGDVHAFDTLLVAMRGDDGRTGLGEATYLAGYTDEDMGGGWALAQTLAPHLQRRTFAEAPGVWRAAIEAHPFTVTAFAGAVEMLAADPLLAPAATLRVPVLGLLNATQEDAIAREMDALFAAGYRTLKVKAGFAVDDDLARVGMIQRRLAGRGTLRVDANQGYSRTDGCRFAERLAPDGVELFEQPCKAGDWDSAIAVARVARVPMMLDESIYGLADIRRAQDLAAAHFIKLKLMKLGGLQALVEGIATIRACGMEPVLGNGVAGELGCWMEACVAARHITNAGEMNGFLKPAAPLLADPLRFEQGAIVIAPGWTPRLDPKAVARVTREKLVFS
ncbi:MAG: mandelate racemase/muconate lactonizing enzyme family protein [Burkholderiales bacterium]